MRSILSTSLLVGVLAATMPCMAPSVARAEDADDAEVTRMAKEHYRLGLDAYKAGKYDVAIKELKKAYLLKRLPALLLNIGATYRKLGDLDLATHFYQKYLDEVPPTAKDRGDVQKLIAEIKLEKETGGAKAEEPAVAEAAPAPAGAPAAKRDDATAAPQEPGTVEDAPKPTEWAHHVVDAAPPEMPLDIRVAAPVMKGVKVFVFYRQPGEESFTPVLMKRRGNEKIGRIPADAVTGKSLQYYIEARDPAGTVVRSAGSQSNPNVVMIDPSARPQIVLASVDSSQRPSGGETQPELKEQPADDDSKAAGSVRNLDDEAAPVTSSMDIDRDKHKTGKRKFGKLFWIGVGVGGAGVAALAVGIAGNMQARNYANAVSNDSRSVGPDGQPFRYNDPAESANDHSFDSKGKMWNAIGIAGTVGGAALAVAGAALITYDQWFKGYLASREKAKPRKRKPVESPSDRDPDLSWYLTPAVGPRLVGVGGGFEF